MSDRTLAIVAIVASILNAGASLVRTVWQWEMRREMRRGE